MATRRGTWCLVAATLMVASIAGAGDAEARRKRGPAKSSAPASGCCPTCICGGLMAPAETKRSQQGRRPASQVGPQGLR